MNQEKCDDCQGGYVCEALAGRCLVPRSGEGGSPPTYTMDAESAAIICAPHSLDVVALARIAAKRHHYALTIHGSLARDLDLVAVPWREDASDAAVLVEAIRKAVGGYIMVADDSPDRGRDGYFTIDDSSKHSPVERPHGRKAWSIYGVLGGSYIDLSVMPLAAAALGAARPDNSTEYDGNSTGAARPDHGKPPPTQEKP